MTLVAGARIALVLDHLESGYQRDIIDGVRRTATRYGGRLVVVAGGPLGTSERPVVRNFVFSDLSSTKVDGVIVLSGCLSNVEGLPVLEEFLKTLDPTPTVVVGVPVPGRPSVTIDNHAGMFAAVEHLITTHKARKLAFLCGPDSSSEARERLQGFRDAATKHGVEIDERHVVPCGLGREDGASSVGLLFEHRSTYSTRPDALVCVNDDVALGAMESLHLKGIAIPNPLKVVGFDDEVDAQASHPPLTTVRQSARAQGEAAAKMLFEHLTRGEKLESMVLATQLVRRESCGCQPTLANGSSDIDGERPKLARTLRLGLLEKRASITERIARAAGGRMAAAQNWEGRLVDSLTAQVDSESGGAFHWEFERLARRHILQGGDALVCHEVLNELRLQALLCVEVQPERRPSLEDCFQEARFLLSRVTHSVGHEHLSGVTANMRAIRRACMEIAAEAQVEQLAVILSEHLPALGITHYCITALGSDMDGAPIWEVLASRNAGVREEPPIHLSLASLGIDESQEKLTTTVVEPLTFAGTAVGIGTFSWGAVEFHVYEELREALSLAVYLLRTGSGGR